MRISEIFSFGISKRITGIILTAALFFSGMNIVSEVSDAAAVAGNSTSYGVSGTAVPASPGGTAVPVGNDGITPLAVKTAGQYYSSAAVYTVVLKGKGTASVSGPAVSGTGNTAVPSATPVRYAGTSQQTGSVQSSGSQSGSSSQISSVQSSSVQSGNISTAGQTVTKVNISEPGVLRLTCSATTQKMIYINVYSDSSCQTPAGNETYLYGTASNTEINIQISTAGTYYLKTGYSGARTSYPEADVTVTYRAQLIPNAVDGISGEMKIARNLTASDPVSYHRFTVKKKSIVTLYGAELNEDTGTAGTLYASVVNSRNKTIQSTFSFNDSNDHVKIMILKKGTYYLKTSTTSLVGLIKKTNKLGKNMSSKRKKAKVLKKKKKAYGYFFAGDKKKKKLYVKLELKKRSKLRFSIQGDGDATLKWTLYPAKGQKLLNNSGTVSSKGSKLKSTTKFKKGKYLISIQRSQKSTWSYFVVRNLSK